MKKVEIDFCGKPLSIEMGKMAKQANGAAFITYGETALLVTAVAGTSDRNENFLPLSVDYVEKYSAAGKIPGGFFKREGRLSENEILTCRLTDRPLRPLFPKNYCRDTQVLATVLSYDKQNLADVFAVLGASCALHVSDIPFDGPVASIRICYIDGKWVGNPGKSEMETAVAELIVAATRDAVVMVEGEAKEMDEKTILEGLKFASESIQPLLDIQDELRKALGKEKFNLSEPSDYTSSITQAINKDFKAKIAKVLKIKEKMPRYQAIRDLKTEVKEQLCVEGTEFEGKANEVSEVLDKIISNNIRQAIVEKKYRVDDRDPKTIRDISCEVGILPRAHGSALFTRGETQALVTTTLGTKDDEQMIDSLDGLYKSNFMLHYNFPPFCVGETKPLRGPARREIGHGYLAHKAIKAILPSKEDFPYTFRIVSEVLESHGSSSMATVCGAALSLMDAGVPVSSPVAGIAMGLIKEKDSFIVLSDISGDEDHIGDMDFKVAGTQKGITAVQMDIKIKGIDWDVMEQALTQAKEGRLHILNEMTKVIDTPREGMSTYAPRIETIQIKPEKIREVIGSGGKVIRQITEDSGARIEIEDTGEVRIASDDGEALKKARAMIEAIVQEPEIGKVYKGKVTRVMDYGAFVEIFPGTEGLCHVSEFLTTEPIEDANDVISEGDAIDVMVIDLEGSNRIKLSHREVLKPGSAKIGTGEKRSSGGNGRGRGGDRGGRSGGGDRGRGRGGEREGGQRQRRSY